MEIGNVPPTCGIPISQLPHLKNSRSPLLLWPDLKTVSFNQKAKQISMNWEMLTAIGQLATVCVGVPSIIYFAIQLREQTRERRQSAVNALTVQWSDLTKALHEDAEFAAIFLRGLHSFHDLDAVSKLRFSGKEYWVASYGMRLIEP
jgi:hypothetical protein